MATSLAGPNLSSSFLPNMKKDTSKSAKFAAVNAGSHVDCYKIVIFKNSVALSWIFHYTIKCGLTGKNCVNPNLERRS